MKGVSHHSFSIDYCRILIRILILYGSIGYHELLSWHFSIYIFHAGLKVVWEISTSLPRTLQEFAILYPAILSVLKEQRVSRWLFSGSRSRWSCRSWKQNCETYSHVCEIIIALVCGWGVHAWTMLLILQEFRESCEAFVHAWRMSCGDPALDLARVTYALWPRRWSEHDLLN
jgi:hypothetical protein